MKQAHEMEAKLAEIIAKLYRFEICDDLQDILLNHYIVSVLIDTYVCDKIEKVQKENKNEK